MWSATRIPVSCSTVVVCEFGDSADKYVMRATEIPIKQPMRSEDFEKAVFDRWGDECVVCTRRPEEWNRTQNKLSFHHVNGDDTDDRIEI